MNDTRFNVIVGDSTVSALATGGIDAIPVNTIGFYNAVTNQAITTHAEAVKDGFYVAYKVTLPNGKPWLLKSFGVIKPENFTAYSQTCYQAFQPKIVDVYGATIDFSKSYAIVLKLINPDYLKGVDDVNYKDVILSYETETQPSPSATHPNVAAMVRSIQKQITDDKELSTFVTLEILNPADDTAIADLDAWCASNPGQLPKLRFTIDQYKVTSPVADEFYYYLSPQGFYAEVLAIRDFENNVTIDVVQDMLFEIGSGHEVREMERVAGGWNGDPSPYRELSFALKKINYLSQEDGQYNLLTLQYKLYTKGGSPMPHFENAALIFAIPTANKTLTTNIRSLLGTLIYDDATAFAQLPCEV